MSAQAQVEEPVERRPAGTDLPARRSVWRALFRQANFVIGGLILLLVIGFSLAAPFIAPHDPTKTNAALMLMPPGTPGHLLGTDELGRDLLSRVLWGSRLTFGVGLVAAAISAVAGLLFGMISAFYGGVVDTLITRLMDVMMSFPYILLAIVIVAILGPGLMNALLAVAVLGIPFFVRIIRAEVLSLRSSEFVEAARALGARDSQILFRHLLPNIVTPLTVVFSLYVGYLILASSGLSFLGMGAQPPTAEWGAMLASGRQYIIIAPHVALVPGTAIFVLVLGTNLMGEGISDALDPKREGRGGQGK